MQQMISATRLKCQRMSEAGKTEVNRQRDDLTIIRYQSLEVGKDFLFFDRAVDVSQVIAKRVTGIGGSLFEVAGEVQLGAQRPAGLNSFRLSPLRFPNVSGGYKQLFDIFQADEKAAVVICENDITRLHLEIAEAGMLER